MTFFNLSDKVQIKIEKYNEVIFQNEIMLLLLYYNTKIDKTSEKLVSYQVCITDPKEWMGVTNDISVIFQNEYIERRYDVWTTKDSFEFYDNQQNEYFEILK